MLEHDASRLGHSVLTEWGYVNLLNRVVLEFQRSGEVDSAYST